MSETQRHEVLKDTGVRDKEMWIRLVLIENNKFSECSTSLDTVPDKGMSVPLDTSSFAQPRIRVYLRSGIRPEDFVIEIFSIET